jgi:hypothetical protein
MSGAPLQGSEERAPDFGDARTSVLLVALFALLLAARHGGRTFWLDELWLVRWLRDGFTPDTPVPPLFVAMARATGALFGFGERALRIPALLGYGALIVLPALLPRRRGALVSGRFALLWSLLLALSSPVGFYATQLKQYTWEAALGAALMVAYLAFDRAPEARGPVQTLFALALLAPLVAVPALLVVVPVMAVAWIRLRSLDPALSQRRAGQRLLAAGTVGSGAVLALVAARAPSFVAGLANQQLKSYWATRYWDGSWAFFRDATRHWLGQSLNLVRGGLVILALLALLWLVAGRGERTRRALFSVVCVAPLLLALAASRLGRYPYGEVRLMLFALPGALALLAAGFEALAARWRRLGALAAGLFVLAFAYNGAVRETYNSSYMRCHDARDVNALLTALWRPGSVLVADPGFVAQLGFYHPELAAGQVTIGSPDGATAGRREIRVAEASEAPEPAGTNAAIEIRVGSYEVTVRESSPVAATTKP